MFKFTLIMFLLALVGLGYTWLQAATMGRVGVIPGERTKEEVVIIRENARRHGVKALFVTAGFTLIAVISLIITIIRW